MVREASLDISKPVPTIPSFECRNGKESKTQTAREERKIALVPGVTWRVLPPSSSAISRKQPREHPHPVQHPFLPRKNLYICWRARQETKNISKKQHKEKVVSISEKSGPCRQQMSRLQHSNRVVVDHGSQRAHVRPCGENTVPSVMSSVECAPILKRIQLK